MFIFPMAYLRFNPQYFKNWMVKQNGIGVPYAIKVLQFNFIHHVTPLSFNINQIGNIAPFIPGFLSIIIKLSKFSVLVFKMPNQTTPFFILHCVKSLGILLHPPGSRLVCLRDWYFYTMTIQSR